jgi:SAM-dependent methyltransferase
MTNVPEPAVAFRAASHHWDQGVWCTVAAVLAQEGADPAMREAAAGVLAAAGLSGEAAAGEESDERQVTSQFRATLLQAAALVSGESFQWLDQSDEALMAQGLASAQGGPMFARYGLPHLPGLAARLAQPGARMLDVGTGVAALAVAYAQVLPTVDVTGIDVSERVLALARSYVATTAVADRVHVRQQDVAALEEEDAYDLAWLPAPFLPPEPLRTGIVNVARALRPGGWILLGHGKFDETPLENALTRLRTLAYGGTPLTATEASALLESTGLISVRTVATPPGAPAVTVAQRPEA